MPASTDTDRALAARIGDIAAQCVKCGLCLPTCPTYQLQRNEAESPRGRIAIAAAIASGKAAGSSAQRHIDSCLSCGACDAVCPSNVPYQELIGGTRALQRAARRESWRRRALRHVLENPVLRRAAAPIARALHAPLRRAGRVGHGVSHPTHHAPALSAETIALLSGCSGEPFEQRTLAATSRLLGRCGMNVQHMPARCCGALAWHAGDPARADALGRALGKVLSHTSATRCTGVATGCAARSAAAATASLPYVDPMELLWAHRERLRFRHDTRTVALHLPCTQRQQPGSVLATQALLQLVPGIRMIVLPHRGRCCGGAGTYFIDHPQLSAALLRPTLDDLVMSSADVVLSANIGCRIQIAGGSALPVLHPLEYLDLLLEA
jgi:glycolate oxidase iron-sulfur subunit